MTLKKTLMTTLWRVQQAQAVISIAFWSLTLAGVFYPYVAARWLDDALGADKVALGLALLVMVVVAAILAFGYVYDRLKFWKEQMFVTQERNPFTYGGLVMPAHIVLWDAVLTRDPAAIFYAQSLLKKSLEDPSIDDAYHRILEEVTR